MCLFAITYLYPGFGEQFSCCSVGNSRIREDVEECARWYGMSVPVEDDSKSDTTQNLFKHSPVPPPPLSPHAAAMFLRRTDGRTFGWLSIRNRGGALHRPDALLPSLPRLQHAGSQSQDTWPSVRVRPSMRG